MFQTKMAQKIKTHFIFNKSFRNLLFMRYCRQRK